MKKLILILIAVLIATPAFAGRVRGYYRKNGTYVQPHYRSNPDSSTRNNYSTKGNYNPYTGKQGTIEPNYGYGSPSIQTIDYGNNNPYGF